MSLRETGDKKCGKINGVNYKFSKYYLASISRLSLLPEIRLLSYYSFGTKIYTSSFTVV